MNSLAWIGIVIWGIIITAFGLTMAGPPQAEANMQPQDVVFLTVGGMLTCMIGLLGLFGLTGWIPGLRSEQKSSV